MNPFTVIGIIKLLFVLPLRIVVAVVLFLFSIVSHHVGKIGTTVLFRGITYVPIRIVFSPEEARILRDDFMTGMDDVAEVLIERHFGEGYAQAITSQRLQEGLGHGEFIDTQSYDTGEFGVSLLLTVAAVALAHSRIQPALAEALSLWIATATLILIFAVGTRIQLINLLAYEGPAGNGSLVENTKRFAWNSAFLCKLHPLPYLIMLKISKSGSPKLYRLTAHSYGVALLQSITEDTNFTKGFVDVFLTGFVILLRDERLPSEVPSAEAFGYIESG